MTLTGYSLFISRNSRECRKFQGDKNATNGNGTRTTTQKVEISINDKANSPCPSASAFSTEKIIVSE